MAALRDWWSGASLGRSARAALPPGCQRCRAGWGGAVLRRGRRGSAVPGNAAAPAPGPALPSGGSAPPTSGVGGSASPRAYRGSARCGGPLPGGPLTALLSAAGRPVSPAEDGRRRRSPGQGSGAGPALRSLPRRRRDACPARPAGRCSWVGSVLG